MVVLGAAIIAAGAAAAAPLDPAAAIAKLVDDLDLQTKMPGDPEPERKRRDDVASDANLHIPFAQTIMWAALAATVLLALFALRGYLPVSRRDRTASEDMADQTASVEAAERMVQTGDDADDLAALGRIAEAMHLLLLRSLVELRSRLAITLADSLTSREILHRLTLPVDGKDALGDLIRRVEFAHFGAKPSSLEDYAACRASYERLIAAMLDGATKDANVPAAWAA